MTYLWYTLIGAALVASGAILIVLMACLSVSSGAEPKRPRGVRVDTVEIFTPIMSPADAWDILGIRSHFGSKDTVDAAYRDLMKKVHPDAGGTAALARIVTQARDVLIEDLTPPNGSDFDEQPHHYLRNIRPRGSA